MKRKTWEDDEDRWPTDARWANKGDADVAWKVYGWETEADEDTEWTGLYVRTGRVIGVMVGDNQRWSLDPDSLTQLDELAYCAECGQIGCTHDGRDREEA